MLRRFLRALLWCLCAAGCSSLFVESCVRYAATHEFVYVLFGASFMWCFLYFADKLRGR